MGNQCLRDMFHLVDGDNHSNIDHHKDITHHLAMFHLKDINNQRLGIDVSEIQSEINQIEVKWYDYLSLIIIIELKSD